MAFAYNDVKHEYIDLAAGEIVPHITSMLEESGWMDARWYTEESSARGRAVHQLTADYDLGAIDDPRAVTSTYKGWLLGHVAAMGILRPTWRHVEEPLISVRHHYGGRPDRAGLCYAAESVVEIKTGAHEKWHGIQTALQAILVSEEVSIPPEFITRYGLYLSGRGRFHLEEFVTRADVDEAYRIIRQCCGGTT